MTPTANGTLPRAVRVIAELGSATVVLQGKREIREARLFAFAFKNATYEVVDRAMVTDPSAPVLMMHMADGWSGPIVRGPLLALRAFRLGPVWPRLQFVLPGWFEFGRCGAAARPRKPHSRTFYKHVTIRTLSRMFQFNIDKSAHAPSSYDHVWSCPPMGI